jgi:hypothetical protein
MSTLGPLLLHNFLSMDGLSLDNFLIPLEGHLIHLLMLVCFLGAGSTD